MSKKSSTSTSGPSKAALPYLNQATSAVTNANNANQNNLNNIDQLLQGNMGSVANTALNNPTLNAASAYDTNVLGSSADPTQNPLFMKALANTNSTTADAVNGSIGTRGLAGGSAQTQLLADQIGKADNSALLSQYNQNVGAQQTAASNATSVAGAQDSGINSLLQYVTAQAGLPTSGADDLATQIQKLWGNSTSTTSSPSFLQNLFSAVSAASGAVKAAAPGGL